MLTTDKTVSQAGLYAADARSIYDLDQRCNYSTSEHIVGYWIDGKPVYELVFHTTCPSTSADGTRVEEYKSLGVSNIKQGISLSGGIVQPNDAAIIPFGVCDPTSQITFYAFVQNHYRSSNPNSLRIFNSNKGWNGQDIYAVIRYTKTTD